MSLDSFGVYFNSGQNNRSNTYTEGDNVTHIQINNSDQTYYQDAMIELYDCASQQVGDDVDIYINDSLEFAGYVSRKQIHHKAGKNLYSYQLIGKTYDLWRYRVGESQTYTGYTGYIASSLIHDWCTGIHGNSNITEGVNFETKIDLSDQTVGDALVTLIGYDGFKFYIDNDNNLVYYDPDEESTEKVMVDEDDILDMSPVEEADEDLVNDVLVIGAQNYYTTTEIPLPAGKAIANVSSGTFKRNTYIAQRVKAKEDTLSAIRMFLNRSAEPYEPENNVSFEVWDSTTQQLMNDSFSTGKTNWSVTSNTRFSGGSLVLSPKGTGFNVSGYALSKSFGSLTRKRYDKYMKVDIEDVISSQRVYISGSNSGSRNWKTLTDNTWYGFLFENPFSSQVKIWLSGNGTYTPKVGSVAVSISDEGAGPGGVVFTDSFSDYTYLSGASFHGNVYRNHAFIDSPVGLLMMSSSKGYTYLSSYLRPDSIVDVKNAWDNESYMIDSVGTATAANSNTLTNYEEWTLTLTLDKYRDISKIYFVGKLDTPTDFINLYTIWVSGNWTGKGYIKAYGNSNVYSIIIYGTNNMQSKEFSFYNNCIYYDVKKILISGEYLASDGSLDRIYDIQVKNVNRTTYSGSIRSKQYNIGQNITRLKLSPTTETYPNRITYSGSRDNGTTWTKLTKNEFTTLGGAAGTYIGVMYNFKPSTLTTTNTNPHISTQNLKNASPSIDSAVVEYTVGSLNASALPKSGTKLERSSDIYIEPSDVPYPPSYSAWTSFTHPALRQNDGTHLDTDNYYWIIMHAYSGATTASEYWKYYCDWNSTYTDGQIAMSTGNNLGAGVGVTWKTWDTTSTWVPKGSLIMDIGWKGDEEIRATATNATSIATYGRHQKIVKDTKIDSFVLASSMANQMVVDDEIPKKGSITIDGRTGIKTNYQISSNLEELQLGGLWEIISYSQIIDKEGFRTNLQYGKPVFDITKRIADIERKLNI